MKRKTVGQEVIERLTDEIIQFKLLPGQEISAVEMAERYHVSKTPLREAFMHLADCYLAEIYPQKGTRIALIDMSLVEQYRFLRRVLEPEIIRIICTERLPVDYMKLYELNSLLRMYYSQGDVKKVLDCDEEFHRQLFVAAGKGEAYRTMEQLSIQYKRVNYLKMRDRLNSGLFLDEHEKLLEYTNQFDEKRAVAMMKQHVERMSKERFTVMEKYPQFFK